MLMNRERVLLLARAAREHPTPPAFTMSCYAHGHRVCAARCWPCDTPGCLLGTYAAREDLQGILKLADYGDYDRGVVLKATDHGITHYDQALSEHFGLTEEELGELFSSQGCGGAQTPAQAAAYVEAFVARKDAEAAECCPAKCGGWCAEELA